VQLNKEADKTLCINSPPYALIHLLMH